MSKHKPKKDQLVYRDMLFANEVRNGFKGEDKVFIDTKFIKMTMEGAHFFNAVFLRCSFTDVDLYWAHLYRARFLDCQMLRVDLRANLEDCVIANCELTECNFGKDNIGGATDTSKLVLVGVHVTDCQGLKHFGE